MARWHPSTKPPSHPDRCHAAVILLPLLLPINPLNVNGCIIPKLNEECKSSGSNYLINLASQEYFKATQPKKLEMEVISPVFKDEKNGKFKIISFYAKKARGMMSSFLIRNQVETLEGIRAFNDQGYQFEPSESTNLQPIFLRSEKNRIAA